VDGAAADIVLAVVLLVIVWLRLRCVVADVTFGAALYCSYNFIG
jgi:hypothetical protein